MTTSKYNQAFIINLDLSTKRWEKISTRFDEVGMPYTRFSGILGDNINIRNTKTGYSFLGKDIIKNPGLIDKGTIYEIKCNSNTIDFTLVGRKFNAGEIGGWCSHFLIWKMATQNNYQTVLVFEDDFIPTKDKFVSKLNTILEEVPKTYDLLYLHASIANGGKVPLINSSAVSQFSKGSDYYLLMAYAFSNKFANNMVQLHHFTQSNDNYLSHRKDLEVYVASDNKLHDKEASSSPYVISMMGCRAYHQSTCDMIKDINDRDL